MSNKSIQQIFSSQVLYFALVPLALVVVVVFFLFVEEAIDKAKKTALWQARSIAIEMRQGLESIRNRNQRDSEIEFLGNATIQTGLANPAIKHLQSTVVGNNLLSAALLLNLEGEVVEAYPFAWFSTPPERWKTVFDSESFTGHNTANAELFYLQFNSSKKPSISPNKKYQAAIEEGPFLASVSPLIVKQDSFTQPYIKTGYIVYLSALQTLVKASLRTDMDVGVIRSVNVLMDDAPAYSFGDASAAFDFKGASLVENISISSSEKSPLMVESQNSLFDHLAAAYVSFIVILLIFCGVAYVIVMHSRRIKVQIDTPLKSIVKDCELIAEGGNAFNRKIYPFSEFQVIHNALEKMSITIARQLESINEEKEKAQKSELVKSQFLANMSHEIRTPINGIIGMLTLVEKSSLTSEQQRKIGIAQKSAISLVGLINDILDFSKIEAQKMELEYIEFNLLEMLDSLMEILSVKAHEKNIALHLDSHNLQVRTAVGDEGRIRQVLLNIIGNAIKFTEKGGVRVIANYYIDHQNKGLFVCEVHDTGIGMNSEQLKAIFNNFVQADSSTTRKFGGTGLGLAISKKLTELMNGNISVDSDPGKGSCFTFEIPLQPGEDAYPVNSTFHPKSAYGSLDIETLRAIENKRILLVEDNLINQEVVRGLLEEAALQVETAIDGLQALNKLKQTPDYSLILMDCQMPVLDGFQTTQAIRNGSAGPHYKKIPIVALTANAFAQDRQRCLDAGMDDYLSKPVEEQMLLEKIYKYVDSGSHVGASIEIEIGTNINTPVNPDQGQNEPFEKMVSPMNSTSNTSNSAASEPSTRQIQAQSPEGLGDIDVAAHWDRENALHRVRQKEDRLHRLIDMFLQDASARMESLFHAQESKNFDEVKLISHSIKGIAANLSATKLMDLSSQLELAVTNGDYQDASDWLMKLDIENAIMMKIFRQELAGDLQQVL